MFSLELFRFLEQLGANNTKERMDEHRDWYHTVRAEYLAFVTKLIVLYETIDPNFHDIRPQDIVFRINRDIRYSKNKSPYKSWMSVHFVPGGKKSGLIGPYIHIQPGNSSFIGGGLWQPPSPILRTYRDYTAIHYKKFHKILTNQQFISFFGPLFSQSIKTTPKGFAKNHPALTFLQYTSFTFQKNLSDTVVLSPDFLDICVEAMQLQYPFNNYINTAIEEGREIDDAEIFA